MRGTLVLVALLSFVVSVPVEARQSPFTNCATQRQVVDLDGTLWSGPTLDIRDDLMAAGYWRIGGAGLEEVTLYRPGTPVWVEHTRLTPTPHIPSLGFGRRVRIENDMVLVSAPYDPSPSTRFGAVYVFEQSGSSWQQTGKASGPTLNEFFGDDFDFDGQHLVVGAPVARGTGGAYVFRRQGSSWVQLAFLHEPFLPYASDFGRGVAVDGDWIAVGAPAHGHPMAQTRVLMYRRGASGTWNLHSELLSTEMGDRFGSELELEDRQLIVGAYGRHGNRGRVHVFQRPLGSGSWVKTQELDPPFSAPNRRFGWSIDLERNRLAIGAPEGFGHDGAVEVYVWGGSWIPLARLRPSLPPAALQDFGTSVAVSAKDLVVGASGGPQVFAYELGPQCPVSLCQAKINSLFCYPTVDAEGLASLTTDQRFEIVGRDIVPDEQGFLLYGTNGARNLPFHGGRLCVKQPFVRVFPVKGSGHAGPGICSGQLRTDFNARIQSGADPSLEPGVRVVAQWIYRDPPVDAFGDGLTDALEFVVAP